MVRGVWWAAGAFLLLAGCDWAEQAQGSHTPRFEVNGRTASLALVPRDAGAVGPADSALACTEAKEIGAPYPVKLWLKVGDFPGAVIERAANGGWNVGGRYVADQLSLLIDRQRFETLGRAVALAPDGGLVLSGDVPQDEALFKAIARARTVTLIAGAEERSLAVAVWRKELIEMSEICEQNTLAWQFLQ